MGATVSIEGELRPDGTLELGGQVALPPGPVRVTVESLTQREDVLTVLNRIWDERKRRGMAGRTREEIDADIRAMRDEWDDHLDRGTDFSPVRGG